MSMINCSVNHCTGLELTICVEFDPGSYVVNYGFIYVVNKYARDFYMENL